MVGKLSFHSFGFFYINGALYFLRPMKNASLCIASHFSSMKILLGGQKKDEGSEKKEN